MNLHKELFILCRDRYEDSVAHPSDLTNDSFYIEEYEYNREYVLFTRGKFETVNVTKCSCIFEVFDDEADTDVGTWEKDWECEDVSDQYLKNNPSLGFTEEFIKSLIEKLKV